jgi:hypothetical protein
MKYIRVVFLLVSVFSFQNTNATQYAFYDEKDEFTDEAELKFLIMDDEALGGFAVVCSDSEMLFAGNVQSMFVTEKNINLKFRFDKGETITKRIPVVDYNSYLLRRDKVFLIDLLKRIKNSDMFILKVGAEKTQKFTSYVGIGAEIDKFLDAARGIDGCNL